MNLILGKRITLGCHNCSIFLDCGEGKKKAEIYTDVATSRDKRDLYRNKREETEDSER